MQRRAFKLLLFLLAGAIINITVAWACAVWVDTSMSNGVLVPAKPDATTCEILWIQSRFGHTRTNRIRPVEDAGDDWWRPILWRDAMRHPDGGEVSRSEDSAGWPMRSLRCTNLGVVGSRAPQIGAALDISTSFGLSGGIELPARAGPFIEERWRSLPLTPIWPGLAINTIFYAVTLWLIFAIRATFKRRLRIKRGLCPLCAYDMRGSAMQGTCPECGWSAIDEVVCEIKGNSTQSY